jgi:hypothetical protein
MAYPVCDLLEDWDGNNEGQVQVTIPPTGSFVTQPCASGETGPLRNCGFVPDADNLVCTAGQQVQMSCQLNTASSTAAPQVLRLCESSAVLGTGTACSCAYRRRGGGGGRNSVETQKCLLPPDPPVCHTPHHRGGKSGVGVAGETAVCFLLALSPRPPPLRRLDR